MADTASDDELAQALEALDTTRDRFVHVVGHELRTPVTTLRGLAEELVGSDGAPTEELAEAILRNARRVESLLDDLLLATDITTALPLGDPEPVDLVPAAQATWDALEVDADLELTGEPELRALLRPGAADTMLARLLDNARRYGQPPFRLDADLRDGRAILTMSSEGAELRPDDVRLAFELFYRAEAAVTSAPGFGLGLPVARALARQHGGDLTIESRAGGGLEVRIDLPAAR
jgi:signal transduction histidine kinase